MLDEEHTGFPGSLVAALDSSYRVERRTAAAVFYVPNGAEIR